MPRTVLLDRSTPTACEISHFSSQLGDTDTAITREMQLPVAIRSQRPKVVGMRSARFAPVHLSPTSTGDKFLSRPANRFYASPAFCYQKVDYGSPKPVLSVRFRFPVRLQCGFLEFFFFLGGGDIFLMFRTPVGPTEPLYLLGNGGFLLHQVMRPESESRKFLPSECLGYA